jgi:predicted transposase YdaD
MAAAPNPHDAYFRQAFGHPRHMAGLLQIVLPGHLQAMLDLDPARLRFLDPAHVDPELRGTASDLIVEVPRRRARGSPAVPAIFIFAVEHQSRDERFMVFRQLGYCVRIWERWLRDHPEATHLPPIVPVVVHNGDRPWRSPTRLDALLDLPDVPRDARLRSLLPSLEFVLADLAGPDLTREAMRAAGAEPVSETLVEILQAATRPEAEALFDQWTTSLAPLCDEPAGGSTLVAVLWYLLNVSAVPDERIVAASEALPEPTKESFMTGAEQLIQKGLVKGRQEGLMAGRQEGRQEGEHAALAAVALRLTRLRFGDVPPETEARISAASNAELERWIEGILTAERLADLFG